MSAKEQVKKEIIEAYVFLRNNNMTIPSETLEFMKDSSLEALDEALIIPDVVKSLEVKEEIVFEDWLKQHRFTKDINDYVKNNITYREWEVFNMYTMDVYNL